MEEMPRSSCAHSEGCDCADDDDEDQRGAAKQPRRSSARRHASPGGSSDEETASEGEPSDRHTARGSQAAELARSGRQKLVSIDSCYLLLLRIGNTGLQCCRQLRTGNLELHNPHSACSGKYVHCKVIQMHQHGQTLHIASCSGNHQSACSCRISYDTVVL